MNTMKSQPRFIRILLWSALVILTVNILESAIHRGMIVAKGVVSSRNVFDRRYVEHPVVSFLHIAPGALFLMLAPLQFSVRIRTRSLQFHRWSGRLLVLTAMVTGLSAFVVGLPSFGGPVESSARVVFGALFLVAIIRAFVAIRQRDAPRHREWMIRAFAVAIGVSTVRVVALVLVAFTGFSEFQKVFGLTFWLGWILTLGAAELWIRRTRLVSAQSRRAA